ncbi:hypothetical protein [uncultured Pseudodesulfovibrio sp.]|uniref:hypothetical protein n=1 Tax=uncultured Pseudodesulfovibrio sp. TaxID=2035858 RepID=UPI0029C7DD5E|nr:hypothetical protein [uncultured Pseudodesulfovibrio sp.]
MSFVNNISKRVIGVIVGVLALLVVSMLFKDQIRTLATNVLTHEWLYPCIWAYMAICFFSDYAENKDVISDSIIAKNIGKFGEACLNMVTWGVATTTAVALLKGLYIQHIIQNKTYFVNFVFLDYISIFLVGLFLFIISVRLSWGIFWEALFKSNAVDVEPVPSGQSIEEKAL